MPTYTYRAKKSTAEPVTGQVSANSQEEAIDIIHQLGLLPVSVSVKQEEDIQHLGLTQKVKSKELYLFSRHLANLVRSGVPILKALDIIAQQTPHPYFRKVIRRVAMNIKNGRSFSESLSEFPDHFSSLYVTMVRAGEEGSNLSATLASLARYQKRQEEIYSKVRAAMTYPLLMAVVGSGTIIFIMTFVLPKMMGLFKNMGDALPLPTVILLKVSAVFAKSWMWILVGTLILVIAAKRWLQSKAGQQALGETLLRLPYWGKLLVKVELTRFAMTVQLLLKSGISLVNALTISIPILGNETLKKQMIRCKDLLVAGGSFGEGLKQSKQVPFLMGQLISVGEETGNLEGVLDDLIEMYEQEADEQIKIMTTLFEPLMILVVGLIIGGIVFAMLLPIFQVDVLVS